MKEKASSLFPMNCLKCPRERERMGAERDEGQSVQQAGREKAVCAWAGSTGHSHARCCYPRELEHLGDRNSLWLDPPQPAMSHGSL